MAAGKFDDLAIRITSAAVLLILGIVSAYFGGWVFRGLLIIISALMVWELHRILAQKSDMVLSLSLAIVTALSCTTYFWLDAPSAFLVLVIPVLVGFGVLKNNKGLFAVFTILILNSAAAFDILRSDYGVAPLVWVIVVIAVTDVAGYFAGRLIGGPKLAPWISPKKTWSGTAAGWIFAALAGFGFAVVMGLPLGLVGASVLLSLLSQAGDLSESWIKRWVSVKDSSNLIPGHGGFMDRFDGFIGAAVGLTVLFRLSDIPFPIGG
jgi:phosphatidate cytidylyltransferase